MQWVERCVIGHALCPFAAEPVRRGAVRTRVSACKTQSALLAECRAEISQLIDAASAASSPETTLLGVGSGAGGFLGSFSAFLGSAVEVEALCAELTAGTACELQLAIFHPLARVSLMEHSKPLAAMMAAVEDRQPASAAALAIRAPLPIFHFLRSSDVQAAAEAFVGVECIPATNRKRLFALAQREQLSNFVACLGAASMPTATAPPDAP